MNSQLGRLLVGLCLVNSLARAGDVGLEAQWLWSRDAGRNAELADRTGNPRPAGVPADWPAVIIVLRNIPLAKQNCQRNGARGMTPLPVGEGTQGFMADAGLLVTFGAGD